MTLDTDEFLALTVKLKSAIPTIADFPISGIGFKDIAPLLTDGELYSAAVNTIIGMLDPTSFDGVLAIDARGFVIGSPLAAVLRKSLVLVRKPGKLPGVPDRFDYECEYSKGTLEVAAGAVIEGKRYIVVDDIFATGGTARATADYIIRKGATVAGYCAMLELEFLHPRSVLNDAPVVTLVRYVGAG